MKELISAKLIKRSFLLSLILIGVLFDLQGISFAESIPPASIVARISGSTDFVSINKFGEISYDEMYSSYPYRYPFYGQTGQYVANILISNNVSPNIHVHGSYQYIYWNPSASAAITYYFRVNAKDSTDDMVRYLHVPVEITARADVTTSGKAYASGRVRYGTEISYFILAHSEYDGHSFDERTDIRLAQPGQIVSIEMNASGYYDCSWAVPIANGSYQVLLDPLIRILPSYTENYNGKTYTAADFSLEFSPGFQPRSAVPIASIILLLLN